MQAKNPIRIEGDTAYITLLNRKGEHVAEAIVDTCDLERICQHKWYAHRNSGARPGSALYVRSIGAYRETGSPWLHRFVVGAERDKVVDHINHQPLDCRRSNLRTCSRSENEQNRAGASVHSRTGVRNVSWVARKQAYRVRVRAFGKTHECGMFKSLADAASAASEARARLHSGFAS